MSQSSQSRYQAAAYILTAICLCTTAILVLFFIFGPKEGMEAMVILLPWLLAGFTHVTIGIAAILCAIKTGSFLKNSWILVYFLLFFSLNAYTLAVMNEVDKAVARKIDNITLPRESELYELLHTVKVGSAGHRQLTPAAAQRARELAGGDTDMNYVRPGRHQTLLLLASLTGDAELVALMIENGAPVDATVSGNYTPLVASVKRGHTETVKVLLDNGADPNDPRYRARPPLILAAEQGSPAITELLLEAGAEVDTQTSTSWPALMIAARKANPEVMKLLLDHGADPNIFGFGNITPLLPAVISDCTPCVQHLVDAGATTSTGRTSDGETPLVLAIKNNNQQIIDIIKSSTTKPGSIQDLLYAVKTADPEILKTLLTIGVDPDIRDDKGNTALLLIATKSKYRRRNDENDIALAGVLLDHGADIDLQGKSTNTALFQAAMTGNTAIARILISRGADFNTPDKSGQTPLIISISRGHHDITDALINVGADPNLQAVWGPNKAYPLRSAVRAKDVRMVKMLIDAGAKIDPASRDLCDLLSAAAGSQEIVRLIVDTGVDLNQRDPLKRYPLSSVMRNGSPESVAYMLKMGASPILPEWKGKQPFMHFVETGQADLVSAFLSSDELLKDRKMLKNGMYWAVRKAHPEVVKVLMQEGMFFNSLDEVTALLEWVKIPPATIADKEAVLELFRERMKEHPQSTPRKTSTMLIVTPQPAN